jgi:uncharacterized protein (DUF433 family)
MAKRPKPEDSLVRLFLKIRNGEYTDREATKKLRECLLAIGSATPDNQNCTTHIEVGRVRRRHGPSQVRGAKIRGRAIMISDLLDATESAPMPEFVRERFPSLTLAEWEACLRFVMLVLISLEHHEWPNPAEPEPNRLET